MPAFYATRAVWHLLFRGQAARDYFTLTARKIVVVPLTSLAAMPSGPGGRASPQASRASPTLKSSNCPEATALRDIRALLESGILRQNEPGGRSTSYAVADLWPCITRVP